MKITDDLLNPYFVDVDESNFTLKEVCTVQEGNNTGNTYEQTIGYYSSLQSILRKVALLKVINEESVVDLKTFANKYITVLQNLLQIDDESLQQFTRSSRVQEESSNITEPVKGSSSEQ